MTVTTNPRFRGSQVWRKAAESVIANAKRDGLGCALCAGAIDFDAPPRSKWSPAVDHIRPLSRGGHPTEISNLQIVHTACNSRKGARTTRPTRYAPTRPIETAAVAVCANVHARASGSATDQVTAARSARA